MTHLICWNMVPYRYIRDSCEVGLFLNDLDGLSKLCQITIKTIPEKTIMLNNRESLEYCNPQTITITCNNDGMEYTRRPDVNGLIRIILPKNQDCTVVTKSNIWKADVYLNGYPDVRTKPITGNTMPLLGSVLEEIGKNQDSIKLPPYIPQNLDSIVSELNKVNFQRRTHWALIAAAIVFTIIIIIIVIVGIYLFRNKKALSFLKGIYESGSMDSTNDETEMVRPTKETYRERHPSNTSLDSHTESGRTAPAANLTSYELTGLTPEENRMRVLASSRIERHREFLPAVGHVTPMAIDYRPSTTSHRRLAELVRGAVNRQGDKGHIDVTVDGTGLQELLDGEKR